MVRENIKYKEISDEVNTYLGQRCRELRNERGISIKSMAKDLGLSFSSLCQFETNKRCMSISKAMFIFDYLGVDFGEEISNFYNQHYKH